MEDITMTTDKETQEREIKDEKGKLKSLPSIEIKVLFFARARDLTGFTNTVVSVKPGCTTLDCVAELFSKFPSLREIKDSMALALNKEYAPGNTILNNGDELAIIPPISGG
ncbi:hypothetical protein AMTRI_Chr11g158330 [Amborella trichopoda]|uniref:Molybdopterin synthase sulfur carrier subunit n=1 Tax=Amborella trichopoda TaxID=13333 RepID=W1NWL0_AMBTC|nr:molybdopterin synthase sulfur carrier subunit [Amborella trichopoda]ERM99693.1 hypothetical protein AMTR_s00099p00069580 [Amborella trichopoda]|eukprot:XP_006836840.1 molybdopterin synthase sulfur carrier subunit [Amborella trichopoda]